MREYKSNLFSKRHYEWLVDMCIDLELTNNQVTELSSMLLETNPNYNRSKFVTTITNKRNKTSGGI